MAKCVYCGAELVENAKFCRMCGARTPSENQIVFPEASAAPQPAPVPQTIEEPVYYPPSPIPAPAMANPAPVAPVQAAQKKKPHRRGFLGIFGSVLVCILILAFMLPTFLLITVSTALTEETFLSIMLQIDLDAVPASVLDEYDPSLEGLSLAEFICREINQEGNDTLPEGLNIDLTPKGLNAIKNKSSLLPFLAEHMEGILNALLDGKEHYRISQKKVEKLLRSNLELLSDELDLPMEDFELEETAAYLLETTGLGEIPLGTNWSEGDRQMLSVLDKLVSGSLLIVPLGILAFFVILLFLINIKDVMYAVRDVGIVSILGSLPLLLVILGANSAPAMYAGKDAAMYLGSVVLSCVLSRSLVILISVFSAGVLLLILNGIIRAVQKKRNR